MPETAPRRPTHTDSLLRIAQHEALSTVRLDGQVLDVGGSKKSDYHRFLKGEHTVTFANIDLGAGADLQFDAERPWPVPSEAYDAVVMSNLLEHLYDHARAVAEAFRVLRPGGRLVVTVPFLFRIHAAPCDYFRYTHFALSRMLAEQGFEAVEVTPLGGGVFSALYQTSATLLPRPVAWLARKSARGLDRLVARLKPDSAAAKDFPLGYLAVATKPARAAHG